MIASRSETITTLPFLSHNEMERVAQINFKKSSKNKLKTESSREHWEVGSVTKCAIEVSGV
jgi:hypothetical protein